MINHHVKRPVRAGHRLAVPALGGLGELLKLGLDSRHSSAPRQRFDLLFPVAVEADAIEVVVAAECAAQQDRAARRTGQIDDIGETEWRMRRGDHLAVRHFARRTQHG